MHKLVRNTCGEDTSGPNPESVEAAMKRHIAKTGHSGYSKK